MTPTFPPHTGFLAFAETLADVSRAMLLKAAQQLPEVTIKADASYVTTTDKAVEQKLREMIIAKYPDHGIFGEEFENVNTDAEFVWVLDPIDGTVAFVAGIPVYGTLIALAWQGKPFVGVIDHPLTDDRWIGVSYTSAFHNGVPVTTRRCETLASAYVTCSNSDFMSPDQLARFTKLRKQVAYVQYGGSCLLMVFWLQGAPILQLMRAWMPLISMLALQLSRAQVASSQVGTVQNCRSIWMERCWRRATKLGYKN